MEEEDEKIPVVESSANSIGKGLVPAKSIESKPVKQVSKSNDDFSDDDFEEDEDDKKP